MTKSTGKLRQWTDEDQAIAFKLYSKHQSCKRVGELMGRSASTVRERLQGTRGEGRRRCIPDVTHVPPEVLADRDRRMQLAPRDLTAAIMGDPLPTCSYLESR